MIWSRLLVPSDLWGRLRERATPASIDVYACNRTKPNKNESRSIGTHLFHNAGMVMA